MAGHTEDWQLIEGWAAAVSTALLLCAAAIALWQVKEALRIRQAQSLLGFIQHLETRPVRRTRRFLFVHRAAIAELLADQAADLDRLDAFLADRGRAEGGPGSLAELRDDLALLEMTALLDLHGVIPRAVRLAYVAPTIVDIWPLVEPLAVATRRQISSEVYLQHLEAVHRLLMSGRAFRPGAYRHRCQVRRELVTRSRRTVLERAGLPRVTPW